jgi:hypothetical protein
MLFENSSLQLTDLVQHQYLAICCEDLERNSDDERLQ